VNLCDLFTTFCEVMDAPNPTETRSRSLLPLLRGEAEDWPDESVSQYQASFLMIKQGDLKYQWYGEGIEEVLFDLAADPGETRNVAKEPAYDQAMARFRGRKGELGF
jgi:choline-sulfatase